MRIALFTFIKYVILGFTMFGTAVLLAVGTYTILGKHIGQSMTLAVVVSLLSTAGAAFVVTQFLLLWWSRFSAKEANEKIPDFGLIVRPVGRFGDLSNEWFACDASLEIEYTDFSLPHFQPATELLDKRGPIVSSSSVKKIC